MDELVVWGKAFADPARVRIIAALRRDELCVCELADALDMSQSTLSSHLQILKHAGLVMVRKDGKWNYYALAPAYTPLVEMLFRRFVQPLDRDPQLQSDMKRLQQRLNFRDNGRCIVSFVQLNPVEKGGVYA